MKSKEVKEFRLGELFQQSLLRLEIPLGVVMVRVLRSKDLK